MQRLALPRRQQLREIIGQRRQPGRHFALALLRLEQLVRDVERRENRRLVGFHDRPLGEHLLQGLIDVGRDLARSLGRQWGAPLVPPPADHHLDRVLLRAHAVPPLTAVSRACSSRKVSRPSRSCTRTRAASTRCFSARFSCSSSARRPRVSGSDRAAAPPALRSASAFWARVRQPASSSATPRRIASSWSTTRASALSPSYPKLRLQRLERLRQRRVHLALTQRPLRVAERAVPRHAAVPGRDPGPAIFVEQLEPLEQ